MTDKATGQPLAGTRVQATGIVPNQPGARVQATGTVYTAVTNQQGGYTVRDAIAGSYIVRVIMVGFGSQQKTASVSAGQPSSVDFILTAVPFTLEEIVTTATGEQRKRGCAQGRLAEVRRRMAENCCLYQ